MFNLEYTILFGVLIVLLLLLIYKKVDGENSQTTSNKIEGMSSITQDTEDTMYYDELTKEDIDGDMFKIQYQISGLKGMTKQKIQDVSDNVEMAVKTIKEIIPRSRKFFQELAAGDKRIPYTLKVKTRDNRSEVPLRRMVKDVYIKIVLEENATNDTKVLVYRKKAISASDGRTDTEGMYIFPTLSEIKINKQQVVNTNNNYYTFLHEMIRALGFGTLWTVPQYNANLRNYSRMWIQNITSNNPLYVGPKIKKYGGISAMAYYYNKFAGRQANTFKSVPVTGINTKNRWSFQTESTKVEGEQSVPLNGELMTNEIGTKISSVTIGALEDLGYLVNYQKATVDTGGPEIIQNVSIKDASGVNITQDKPGTISNINISGNKKPDDIKTSSTSSPAVPTSPANKPNVVVVPPSVVVIENKPQEIVPDTSSPPSIPQTAPATFGKYTWYAAFIDKRFLIGSGIVCLVMIIFLVIVIVYNKTKTN